MHNIFTAFRGEFGEPILYVYSSQKAFIYYLSALLPCPDVFYRDREGAGGWVKTKKIDS
jgi:hypothetical protein